MTKDITALDHLLALKKIVETHTTIEQSTADMILEHIQPAIDILEAKKAVDDFSNSDEGRLAREMSDKLKESFTKKITTPYGLNMPDIDEFRVSEDG